MRTRTPPSLMLRRGLLAGGLLMSLALFACGGADEPGSRTMPVVPLSAMPPIIHEQPRSQEVIDGGLAMFGVSTSGIGVLKHQWRRNGEPIAGANDGGLILPAAGTQDEGVYTVVISNEAGSVVSEGARLTVRTDQVVRRPDGSCASRAASGASTGCNRVVLFLR
jgi:Immunoglobulin I-set domain